MSIKQANVPRIIHIGITEITEQAGLLCYSQEKGLYLMLKTS